MRIAMKAGKYWLGDPTYLIKEEDMWNAYMDRRSGNDGEAILFGEKCVIFSTMHGDGIFVSNQGHSVPVDSGTIALFPVSLIGECMTGEWMDNVMVTFDEDFTAFKISLDPSVQVRIMESIFADAPRPKCMMGSEEE